MASRPLGYGLSGEVNRKVSTRVFASSCRHPISFMYAQVHAHIRRAVNNLRQKNVPQTSTPRETRYRDIGGCEISEVNK